jgi:colicin import membrane protein
MKPKGEMMEQRSNPYFLPSLLLHVFLLVILVVSFDFANQMPVVQNADKNAPIINAMVMDAPPVPTKTIQKPIIPIPRPELKVAKPPRVIPVIKPQPVVNKEVVAIADKKLQKQREVEIAKQLLADLKTHQDQQKKIKQKTLEAEFAKEMKELHAKSIQQQMLQEAKRLAAAQVQRTQGVVDKYKAMILQTISQHWLVPGNPDKHLSAELLIRVAPGGDVVDVQVLKSSGDAALDRSARTAVLKSSPLPVPKEGDAFEAFRQFVLKVKPESVLSGDSWVS